MAAAPSMLTAASSLPVQAEMLPPELLWREVISQPFENSFIPLALSNFLGRNYPSLDDVLMTHLLQIAPDERVLDMGGDAPFSRADVVADAFPENLPFAEGEFDFAYCRAILEQVSDPARACREMMRVARRGFIETSSPLSEYLGSHPNHRWLVHVERLPGEEPTLVFRRKPFVRAPFRYCLRPHWIHDTGFRMRWEWQYRNLTHTQFQWNGAFRFRVEEDLVYGFDYDAPAQAAEAHLDAALNALRFNAPPMFALLDAERACALRPEWAVAHNTLGCTFWISNRRSEALQAFAEAARLAPARSEFQENARLRVEAPGERPHLVLLPPAREDREYVDSNFAGKVYYAFVSFDDRLAHDLGIHPGERVLDVGGGQRPLKRADVSVDFDVFEGLHRQGQTISREKPLVCGDAQALPFRDKAFDVVCCRMVLEHVQDPARACRELQRVSRRGFIETPNTFWECFYGHPTHRWLIEWEATTRTLVFRRKPFDSIPFRSAIVPFLYVHRDIQRAFEITFRNITTTQITWDEANPFSVRVEDDPDCPYDYLQRPDDAVRGSLSYARDLLEGGLAPIAIAECDDAIRNAPTAARREEAWNLRLRIAEAMNDSAAVQEVRARLSSEAAQGQGTMEKKMRAPLVWSAPLRDPSGYADEARHFLFALDAAGIPVAGRNIAWSSKVASLSPERERILQRLLTRPAPSGAIHVSHILASFFQTDPHAYANVGRTMFETDRLPAGWVEACNRMDAIWVPTEFNRETFAGAGVAREKLRVVPGAIDLAPYDPDCMPLRIDGARGYNFLSVFDWTLRKGWDVLVQAFIEEFRANEDVALIFKTHSSLGYTVPQIVEQVSAFITNTLGRDPNRIPDIVFQDGTISDAQMPHLYRAADCYVMPTRGEGWGRPFMEAMAMRLPTIGTHWSGQTGFMNAENSLLLDYELVEVPATAWHETPTYQGHRWAEPSRTHLQQLMRFAFENRKAGKERGECARAHLEANFTYGPVARILAEELARF